MDCLLCSEAGNQFTTTVVNTGNDTVAIKYALYTKNTDYEFVTFSINKILRNRKTNDTVNETEVEFTFRDYSLHNDQLRSWLLFMRYLQSTFKFAVENFYRSRDLLHIKMLVQSNRTCVDDIMRAYANVKIEEPTAKDKYLLEEIRKIRMLNQFQKV